MMKNVSVSFANRLGMITLLGSSMREKYSCPLIDLFTPTDRYLNAVAHDVGISQPAVQSKHLSCFLNAGLAAYLTRWDTPEVLKSVAMAGAIFESFVVSEAIKSYYNKGILDPPLYFYRDKG